MLLQLWGSAMAAAEKGVIPDPVCRLGIRNLLRQRLKVLESVSVEEQNNNFRRFLNDCRQSAVAEVPELANAQHYEVPAEFFQTVLGNRLKYSCCEWSETVTTLDQAEEAGLATTCSRAQITDGMQILELGCGWGSLSLWMAQNYPHSAILAVSNSRSQREFIEQRALATGLTNLRVITADMNDFSTEQKFDRVVSVEMFEHMRNHEELIRRISTWLAPAGKLFVHIFCHRQHAYLFEALGERDWMAQYFFSGGMMPSETLLVRCQQHLTLEDHWRWDGRHYEKTCNEWLQRQDRNKESLKALFATTYGANDADIWQNRWRMFFMACAELFGYRNGSEWWVSHYLFEQKS